MLKKINGTDKFPGIFRNFFFKILLIWKIKLIEMKKQVKSPNAIVFARLYRSYNIDL